MNRYQRAKKELDLYFAAYGEELLRPMRPVSFHEYSDKAATLKKRSVEAFQAFSFACKAWQQVPGFVLTLDQLHKVALSFVDIFEHFKAEWPPEQGERE